MDNHRKPKERPQTIIEHQKKDHGKSKTTERNIMENHRKQKKVHGKIRETSEEN